MKIKMILVALVLCATISGCAPAGPVGSADPGTTQTPPVSTVASPPPATPDPTVGVESPLSLQESVTIPFGAGATLTVGMTQAEVFEVLEREGIPRQPGENNTYYIGADPLDKAYSDLVMRGLDYTLELSFEMRPYRELTTDNTFHDGDYSNQFILYAITVDDHQIPTDRALVVGDGADRVRQLYGEPHNTLPRIIDDGYVRWQYYKEGVLFQIFMINDIAHSWTIGLDTPDDRVAFTTAQGDTTYLYLWIPMAEAERRLSEGGVPFERPAEIEGNTTRWTTDALDLWFGCTEQRPAPDTYDTTFFELYQYTVKTADYATEKGIAVGDTEEQLLEAYGPAWEIIEKNGAKEHHYTLGVHWYLLGIKEIFFTVESGRIVSWSVSIADWVTTFNAAN